MCKYIYFNLVSKLDSLGVDGLVYYSEGKKNSRGDTS